MFGADGVEASRNHDGPLRPASAERGRAEVCMRVDDGERGPVDRG